MTPGFESSLRGVGEAAETEDERSVAEAVLAHANDLLLAGRPVEARRQVDEAIEIHRAAGRALEEARCTLFSATLCRIAGELDESATRCERALALSGGTGAVAVATYAELGEIALVRADHHAAADFLGAALAESDIDGVVESDVAAMLRKRATALAGAERYHDAIRDLGTAYAILTEAGDRVGARRTMIETAAALRQVGDDVAAASIVERAVESAQRDADHAASADLHLLRSALALDRSDAATAMSSASTALDEALAARAPGPYIAAVHAVRQIAESTEDLLSAYAALATGWATLGDLLGAESARTTFEPQLRDMRRRWGPEPFARVKGEYDSRRRAER